MRGHAPDKVELERRRRLSPPEVGPYRGLLEGPQNMAPHPPYGPNGPPHPQSHPDLGHGPPQPPESREEISNNGSMGMRPRPTLLPASQKPSNISDPMADPRWAPMMGLLDNSGTEEVVIDGKPFELRMGTSRKLRIHGMIMDVAVDLKERGIRINGQLVYKLGEPIKEVPVADRTVRLYYHGLPKPIWLDGQQHEMRLDAPPRNVMVDNIRRGFQIDGRDMMILVDRLEKGQYGGPPRKIRIVGIDHEIAFQAPPRRILIDGKSCELKLDTKIPYVIINGKPHGIRFDGEPRTVFINDQPFTIPVDRAERIKIGPRPTYIALGGPAHEVIIDGKWFEVKFDNVSKDIHLGNRHFSIRLPGPLPRVKILQELPLQIDDSRLLMTNKVNSQPNQPSQFFPNQPAPQPSAPVAVAPNQKPHIPDGPPNMSPGVSEDLHPTGIPNNIRPPNLPIGAQGPNPTPGHSEGPHLPGPSVGSANLPPRGLTTAVPSSESGQIMGPQALASGAPVAPAAPVQGVSMPPISGNMQGLATSLPGPSDNRLPGPVIPPGGNPGFQGMPPRMGQIGGMAFRPAGEGMMNPRPELLHIGQSTPGFLLSGTQPVMTQPPPMLIQSGPMRQPNQPPLAFQRPGMLGMRQTNNPPVNILAQGFLNQMANNMMNINSVGNIPDIAAGLRALSQLGPVMPMPKQHQHIPPPDDDHGPAMITGMQGHAFPGTSKITIPTQMKPSTTSSQAPILPANLNQPSSVPSVAIAPSAVPSTSSTTPIVPSTESPSAVPSTKAPIDVNSLLSNLLKIGLIKDPSKKETTPLNPSDPALGIVENETKKETVERKPVVEQKKPSIPDFTSFQVEKLRMRNKAVVDQLHEGIQCHTCATRFVAQDHEKYRAHLDWHFRQNKLEQEMEKVAKNRKWFYSIPEWIQYEEIENTEEKSRSEIFEQMKPSDNMVPGVPQPLNLRALEGKDFIKNPVASGIEGEDICATCGDPFDQMWNEETEEWILKNTIKVDGKTYHPVCYEDAQETPVEVLESNSLKQELKESKIDGTSELDASDQSKEIKQEPISPSKSEESSTNIEEPIVVVKQEFQEEHAPEMDTHSTDKSPLRNTSDSASEEIPAIVKQEPMNEVQEKPEVVTTTTITNRLNTISTAIVREVIPVSQDDPSSPWDMDSNPTPELSRTPTPEPCPSFTPVASVSAEFASVENNIKTFESEDPVPPTLVPEGLIKKEKESEEVTLVKKEVEDISTQ
ncbi:hypothetical protein EGW08_006916 [Elysia chlorotica]|uniref:Pcf11 C-terminal domain-containing protein n=1 Tax=Elysia chlorotica TaxID=188477 RepID=A0A3S1A8G3_ELYCH|nr:hypothetical protein EGW08_006916 [Elysia chlorotica]